MNSTFWSNTQRRSITSSSGWRCSRCQPARYRLSAGGSPAGSTKGPCAGTSVFGCPGRSFWLLPKPWGGWTGFRAGWQKLPPPQRIKRVAVLALAEHGPERLLRSQVTVSAVMCKKKILLLMCLVWWAESFLAQGNIHNYPTSMSKYILLCNLVHSSALWKHYRFFKKVLETIIFFFFFFLCRII